jgi:hypothetical protein
MIPLKMTYCVIIKRKNDPIVPVSYIESGTKLCESHGPMDHEVPAYGSHNKPCHIRIKGN